MKTRYKLSNGDYVNIKLFVICRMYGILFINGVPENDGGYIISFFPPLSDQFFESRIIYNVVIKTK